MPEPVIDSATFVLAGPTASGKTDVALLLASRWNAEIIGADAFQVYRGLPILTAKPSADALAAVPHHLVDVISPSETFDAAQYRERALAHMAEIHARGRNVLLVGGAGLYIRAVRQGLAEGLPAADLELRAELEQTPLPVLAERVRILDPEAYATLDLQNPRRVIRALEVCLLSGRPFSSFRGAWNVAPAIGGVVLMPEREAHNRLIDLRSESMFKRGVIEEVRAFRAEWGDCLSMTSSQVLGLHTITRVLDGECSEADAIQQIQQDTRRYAKRQRTWFRKEQGLVPISLDAGEQSLEETVAALQKFLPLQV